MFFGYYFWVQMNEREQWWQSLVHKFDRLMHFPLDVHWHTPINKSCIQVCVILKNQSVLSNHLVNHALYSQRVPWCFNIGSTAWWLVQKVCFPVPIEASRISFPAPIILTLLPSPPAIVLLPNAIACNGFSICFYHRADTSLVLLPYIITNLFWLLARSASHTVSVTFSFFRKVFLYVISLNAFSFFFTVVSLSLFALGRPGKAFLFLRNFGWCWRLRK